jgi:ribosomal protein S18 acetylase RimI-like enzyme
LPGPLTNIFVIIKTESPTGQVAGRFRRPPGGSSVASKALSQVTYSITDAADLETEAVLSVYESSGLAQRRPLGTPGRLRSMLDGSNLIVVARDSGALIGIARSISDFSYATYLSDIAVDAAYQRRGIGRELIRITGEAAPLAKIILLSAPAAVQYYPHIGFTQHQSAWTLPARQTTVLDR